MTMRVGILGGGQLGLMLAESVTHLGHVAHVYDRDPRSPCHQRLAQVTTGDIENTEQLARFFSQVDVVTFDSENISAKGLEPYAHKVKPSLEVLKICQDRVLEKTFLRDGGFRPVAFRVVESADALELAVTALGFPCVAKTVRGGYDGKGQTVVRSADDVKSLRVSLEAHPRTLLLEAFVTLVTELSCIVARTALGQTFAFPVFENLHREQVLDFTLVPARTGADIVSQAEAIAITIAGALEVVGVLTVEFFVVRNDSGSLELFVNELAPRTHNSGHVTRACCNVSQFDALARILTNTPLTPFTLRPGGHCMGQLLGNVWLSQGLTGNSLGLSAAANFPSLQEVYLYGKHEARLGRKMGHFLVEAENCDAALSQARSFRQQLEQGAR
jgi:5-(carboxyamino)imidazole ribonucleotide synthase